MRKKRLLLPACVAAGLLVVALGVYSLLSWFGSPLLPGSLERRCAREVSAHREDLAAFAQICLEEGQVPDCRPLPGLLKGASVWGQDSRAFVEFTCGGWGLGSSTSYYGVYYSPSGPQPFQGAEVELLPKTAAMPGRARGTTGALPDPWAGTSTISRPIFELAPPAKV